MALSVDINKYLNFKLKVIYSSEIKVQVRNPHGLDPDGGRR